MKKFLFSIKNKVFAFSFFSSAFIALLSVQPVQGQEDLNVLQKNWVHFSDAPNALYQHLTGEAYEILEDRKKQVAAINSLEGWKDRQQLIKEQMSKVVGPFPEKTPLNAQIISTVEKGDYKVEHIVFESQPKFYVSSSLFIPKGTKGKAPVIIYCSGHTSEGYRSSTYQHVILNLVKKGFMVFAFDPIGQGERLEYYDQENGGSILGGATKEHSYAGAQAFISGRSEALHMIWDGIRAVDYLLTRKEVDPDRIGITGRSGGGTQSSYIAAVEERIYVAAPENYITNFTRLFETNGPQDAEQNFYHGIAEGLDQSDLLLVRAPKPILMITTTRDMFSIQGARETAKEVSRIYDAYSKSQNFKKVEDDDGHASTLKNREAMYAFFQQHLNLQGDPHDEEVTLLSAEEMKVTPTGQVSTSYNGQTVFSLNKKESEELSAQWMGSRKQFGPHFKSVINAAKSLSGYVEPKEGEDPVLTGRLQRKGYFIEKNYIKGEGDYIVPYLLFIPEISNHKALVYLHPSGKSAEADKGGEIEWFVDQGFTVMAPDLLGIGEMGSGTFKGDSHFEGISFNLWFASLQIGRSIVGVQVADLVRLTRILKNNSGTNQIFAVAKKEMTPVLLHAAAFDPSISRIALVEPLISYRSIVNNRFYHPSFIHSTVPGALTAYDLPDLAGSLAPKKLLLLNVMEGNGEMADSKQGQEDLSYIRAAYQNRNSENQLNISNQKDLGQIFEFYQQWIK